MISCIKPNKKTYFTKCIVNWGKENIRCFPWRRDRNPWKVLLSEIFLQKTTAGQVKKVFSFFIRSFPDPCYILSAKDEELKRIIKNLGLANKRVDSIKRIALILNKEYENKVPNKYEELIRLPGVGQYIANAVLSFGFGKPRPLVDTNVIRLFSRFFDVKSTKSRARYDNSYWDLAEELVHKKNPDLYNYYLLDFCALICTNSPYCEQCILKEECFKYRYYS